jgi:hypothetical protein
MHVGADDLERLAGDARPTLIWRIGVSGRKDLRGADPALLERTIMHVLEDADAALHALHARPDFAQVFRPGRHLATLISPLAPGAERLCAEVAARMRLPMGAVLPLTAEKYRQAHRQSEAEFDSLLERVRGELGVVELDGTPGNAAALDIDVGEFVVRNCDMLLTVGGDAAEDEDRIRRIVAYARKMGVPVVSIGAASPHACRMLEVGVEHDYSALALSQLIASQIIPRVRMPKAHDPLSGPPTTREPSLAPAQTYFCREPLRHTGEDPDFLSRGPLRPAMPWHARAVASIFPALVWLLGKKVAVPGPAPHPPPAGAEESTVRYLFLHHHRADRLASFYANLHRSAFMLVYVLGALALIFAVAALFIHQRDFYTQPPAEGPQIFTLLELTMLVALAVLVELDNRFRWRDRWLEYRLLAELLRQADLLAQIGRSMPFRRIDDLSDDLPGRAWVMVAFRAIVRGARVISQDYTPTFLAAVRDYAAGTRLQHQIAYHYKAEAQNESIGRWLSGFGLTMFAATAIFVGLELAFHGGKGWYLLPGLLAGVLPALAYASFGIRNQAEFEIASRRSERMIAKLTRQRERIASLQDAGLTSEALGREILLAAAIMRHDAADWASIFEVKETEPP